MSKTSDFFRHADKFTTNPVSGSVSGSIPNWLDGVMIRNGPGVQEVGQDRYNHFFDGLALLHRFEIKNGNVTYQNRVLESDAYKRNMAAQRIITSEFGTCGVADPCKSLFDRFKSSFIPSRSTDEITDNCNVNLAFYGDQLYAMTETEFLRRVDPKSLETLGPKLVLGDHLTVNQATAHPHILEDGTILNMGNNYRHKKGPHYCIIQVPPSYGSNETSFKNAKVIAEIPTRWKMYPCYYHSFGMTQDKIVFIEQPFCISIPRLLTANIFSSTFRDCITWYPGHKTRIYVVPRNTGNVEPLIYETDNLFTFHHVNAYEENGNIIMDVAAYNDARWVSEIEIDKIQKTSESSMNYHGASIRRYVLPTRVSKDTSPGENLVSVQNCNATAKLRSKGGSVVDVTPHKFTDFFEFPRINYKYNGKKYNYFYGVEASPERRGVSVIPEPDIISKFEIKTGRTLSWTKKGILVSEPIFVPNPETTNPDEDDGVVLFSYLHLEDKCLVTMVVLNAKDMKELAQVQFRASGPVPSTFHGLWAQTGEKVHFY